MMNEPIIYAKAGRQPRPFISRVFEDIVIRIAAPYAPTSSDPRIFVIDLSQYENVVMAAVKAFLDPMVEALVIRIGGSASVRDTKFKLFWDLAREFKLPRSIYTYNWPGWTVDAHIRNFMESVELWTPGDLGEGPIWVDAECDAGKTKREVSNHTNGYREALVYETGKIVGVYTGAWFIDGFMEIQDWFKEVLFWLALWLYNQPREHPGPAYHEAIPVVNAVMQQTGSNGDGTLFGGSGRIDTDRWQSTTEKFQELFNIKTEPSEPDDLEEKVKWVTWAVQELIERINIIDEYLQAYQPYEGD